jgi:hypothetical protein
MPVQIVEDQFVRAIAFVSQGYDSLADFKPEVVEDQYSVVNDTRGRAQFRMSFSDC